MCTGPDNPKPGRKPAAIFIAAVLGLQLALAVSYYVGDDRFDERFAWRMYSTIRLTGCSTTAAESVNGSARERRIVLAKTLAVAWIKNIRRNRDRVIRKFLETRCDLPGVQRARLQNVCKVPGEPRARHEWAIDCGTGEITREVDRL